MARIEDLAAAVLARDALRARSLVQDIVREGVDVASYPAPTGLREREATMVAALAELLADRLGVPAPDWARQAGRFPEGFHVTQMALRSERARARIERESPPALLRHGVYAPAAFLTFA